MSRNDALMSAKEAAEKGLKAPADFASFLDVAKALTGGDRWGFGLRGLPLDVIVMIAALPVGSNALIFAQRYRCGEVEVTAATVISTLAFVLSAPLWLSLLTLFR